MDKQSVPFHLPEKALAEPYLRPYRWVILAMLWWFMGEDAPSAGTDESEGIIEVFSNLMKVRNVRIVLIAGLLSFAVIHGYMNWLPKILEGRGMSPSVAGFAASLTLLAGIPAILALPPQISTRFRVRSIGVLALLAAAAIVVMSKTSGLTLMLGLAFFGAVGSAMITLLILILMETPEVGTEYMGSAGAYYIAFPISGGSSGP